MRWRDEYLGLLAVTLVFAAVVLWASGASWVGEVPILVLAVILLVVMGAHWYLTPRVLLVGDPAETPVYQLEDALDEAGWGLRRCSGPIRRPCPVYQGRPCPVRGHPVAAVILREAGETGPVPPCGRALRVPSLTVEEGPPVPPAPPGVGEIRVGWAEGPAETLRALRSVVAGSARSLG